MPWQGGTRVGIQKALFLKINQTLTSSALLVTKWVNVLENLQLSGERIEHEEQGVYQEICDLVQEGDEAALASKSIAAELARIWAGFYDDTWVWGGKQ